MNSLVGMGGTLNARKLRAVPPHKARSVKVPGLGRFIWTKDPGDALITAEEVFQTNLSAHHFDGDGKHQNSYDFGSGLTTQSLALALANTPVSTGNISPLSQLKYMTSGVGTAAATAYDYQLQTQSGAVTTGLTPTIGLSADNTTMQWVGTINYTSSLAITEWGLFAGSGTVGSLYNTSSNTFTATTATPGTSPSWTVNTWAGQYIVQVASATSVIGLITSNTATALTINPGWANQTAGGGSGSTPASNTALNIYPLMGDHKVFSAINVVNGDSIQFTYTLTINSGG